MTNFGKWILTEAAYGGNMGIIEMIEFYKKASDKQIKQMEKLAKQKDWDSFKKIIKEVIGVDLI